MSIWILIVDCVFSFPKTINILRKYFGLERRPKDYLNEFWISANTSCYLHSLKKYISTTHLESNNNNIENPTALLKSSSTWTRQIHRLSRHLQENSFVNSFWVGLCLSECTWKDLRFWFHGLESNYGKLTFEQLRWIWTPCKYIMFLYFAKVSKLD